MSVEVVTIASSLTVTVPEEVVEAQLGYLPWVLGENLAGQVDTYVMEERLGYYPALDYFRDRPEAVDQALLQLIDEVATFCASYARRELRRRLSRVFSNVQIEQLEKMAMDKLSRFAREPFSRFQLNGAKRLGAEGSA
jgi:hypothetical protein